MQQLAHHDSSSVKVAASHATYAADASATTASVACSHMAPMERRRLTLPQSVCVFLPRPILAQDESMHSLRLSYYTEATAPYECDKPSSRETGDKLLCLLSSAAESRCRLSAQRSDRTPPIASPEAFHGQLSPQIISSPTRRPTIYGIAINS
eukprot:6174641-Pleurochrysis_carterae.AAC.3